MTSRPSHASKLAGGDRDRAYDPQGPIQRRQLEPISAVHPARSVIMSAYGYTQISSKLATEPARLTYCPSAGASNTTVQGFP